MSYSLGVDLGTTFVAAAVAHPSQVETFTLGDRSVVTPSVVYLREDGAIVTGEAANRRAVSNPDRVGREFKRRIGDPTPVMLGGQSHAVTDLLAAVLRDVLTRVTQTEGEQPEQVVLTHPANWGPFRRGLFEQVPVAVGLEAALLTTEPEAAAAHYSASRHLDEGAIVAVYDLGGGTFDATVLRNRTDGVEILGTPEGIERLGGVDFDEAILNHVNYTSGGALSELDMRDPQTIIAMARLRQDCVLAKEGLSVDDETILPVFLPGRHFDVRITRADFESMVRAPIESTIGALSRTLRSAGVAPADLGAVLLVGGSSRIPLVAEMVSEELGRPIVVDTHPKYAVALGAATLARMTAESHEAASLAAGGTNGHPRRGHREATVGTPGVIVGTRLAPSPTRRSAKPAEPPSSAPVPPTARPAASRSASPPAPPAASPTAPPAASPTAPPAASPTPPSVPPSPRSRPSPMPVEPPAPEAKPADPVRAPAAEATSAPRQGQRPGPPTSSTSSTSAALGRVSMGQPSWAQPSAARSSAPKASPRLIAIGVGVVVGIGLLLAFLFTLFGSSAPGGGSGNSAASEPAAPVVRKTSVPVPSLGTAVPVGATPGFATMSPNGRQLYVANRGAQIVTVVDTSVNQVTATIPVDAGPPQFLTFAPDGKRVYVSIFNPERTIAAIGVLDTTSNKIVATVPVQTRPFVSGVTRDGRYLWVPNHDSGTISVIDTDSLRVVKEIKVAANPHWVSFSNDGTKVYTANHESNLISVLDVASGAVIATVPVGTSPHALAVNPRRPLVANVNYDGGSVSFIDSNSNKVTATVPVGKNPQQISWAPDGRHAYVANVGDGTVSVISADEARVTATIPTGRSPTSVTVMPDGGTAYVTNLDSGTLSVLTVGS